MRYLLLLSTFIVALFSAHNLDAAHNTGEIMFTSMLSGEAEVPAVQTNARGITSFELNSSMDTLFINGTYAGLSGKITGAHIHELEAGMNGGFFYSRFLLPLIKLIYFISLFFLK